MERQRSRLNVVVAPPHGYGREYALSLQGFRLCTYSSRNVTYQATKTILHELKESIGVKLCVLDRFGAPWRRKLVKKVAEEVQGAYITATILSSTLQQILWQRCFDIARHLPDISPIDEIQLWFQEKSRHELGKEEGFEDIKSCRNLLRTEYPLSRTSLLLDEAVLFDDGLSWKTPVETLREAILDFQHTFPEARCIVLASKYDAKQVLLLLKELMLDVIYVVSTCVEERGFPELGVIALAQSLHQLNLCHALCVVYPSSGLNQAAKRIGLKQISLDSFFKMNYAPTEAVLKLEFLSQVQCQQEQQDNTWPLLRRQQQGQSWQPLTVEYGHGAVFSEDFVRSPPVPCANTMIWLASSEKVEDELIADAQKVRKKRVRELEKERREPCPLTIEQVRKFAGKQHPYNHGSLLYAQRKEFISDCCQRECSLSAKVKEYEVQLEMKDKRTMGNPVLFCDCACMLFGTHRQPCKHILALALLYANHPEEFVSNKEEKQFSSEEPLVITEWEGDTKKERQLPRWMLPLSTSSTRSKRPRSTQNVAQKKRKPARQPVFEEDVEEEGDGGETEEEQGDGRETEEEEEELPPTPPRILTPPHMTCNELVAVAQWVLHDYQDAPVLVQRTPQPTPHAHLPYTGEAVRVRATPAEMREAEHSRRPEATPSFRSPPQNEPTFTDKKCQEDILKLFFG